MIDENKIGPFLYEYDTTGDLEEGTTDDHADFFLIPANGLEGKYINAIKTSLVVTDIDPNVSSKTEPFSYGLEILTPDRTIACETPFHFFSRSVQFKYTAGDPIRVFVSLPEKLQGSPGDKVIFRVSVTVYYSDKPTKILPSL